MRWERGWLHLSRWAQSLGEQMIQRLSEGRDPIRVGPLNLRQLLTGLPLSGTQRTRGDTVFQIIGSLHRQLSAANLPAAFLRHASNVKAV
jgi:hypothetical protein